MTSVFSEDTRVKIPALVHMTRLGYKYIPRAEVKRQVDPETNILKDVFIESIMRLNPSIKNDSEVEKLFKDINLELGYDDLGRAFFKRLQTGEPKIIDLENFSNNTFHVSTEVTCHNGEDEFRPDIVFFVNGIPLGFIEVKKPNNQDGIKAERDRMNVRLNNARFRKFFNEFQLYIFSNNMEYDNDDSNNLQGAYYATGAKTKMRYNRFFEQKKSEIVDEIQEINESTEDFILKDNHLVVIKNSLEYKTNKNPETPTNRVITSILSKPRLQYFLRYGIVYVDETDEKTGETEIQKHIMRYPQLFGSKAIVERLNKGMKRGIIWHTQGSGKTALAYFNVKILRDYYKEKGIVPKFYFIVDRIDLAAQARAEFIKRGLAVSSVSDRDALIEEFKGNTVASQSNDNNAKVSDICVVNIQKFKDDTEAINNSGYDIKVQRVFFLDEAHRSYNPKGSFLANLYNSDKESIKIALTGTPLIVGEGENRFNAHSTRDIFGDYIHKYYYNESIRDGYTLKLLREEIETTFREKIDNVYKDIQVQLGDVDKRLIYAHPKYCEPLLDFIIDDFVRSRKQYNDGENIGAMVVCNSAVEIEGKPNQARELFNQFNKRYGDKLKSALITNAEGDKKSREDNIKAFKEGKIDILFVYNMLLTGFDCPRLKKLYLCRIIKAHNLLQTLTRVNRPYKNFRVGYVVDFANIKSEFDKTNQAYLDELKSEYTDSMDDNDPSKVFGSLFMSRKEIQDEIDRIKAAVFDYTLDNLEVFSSQISQIQDYETLQLLRKALDSSRELSNLIRLFGQEDLLKELDFKTLGTALTMVNDRIALLNAQKALEDGANISELMNIALEDVMFNFEKISKRELRLAAEDCQEKVKSIRYEFNKNWDKKDPEYVSLYQAFLEVMRRQNITQEELGFDGERLNEINRQFDNILKKVKELNRKNNLLADKYHGNQKAARVDKKLSIYTDGAVGSPSERYSILNAAIEDLDNQILSNSGILDSEGYFSGQVEKSVLDAFDKVHTDISFLALQYVRDQIFEEYIKEYKGEE